MAVFLSLLPVVGAGIRCVLLQNGIRGLHKAPDVCPQQASGPAKSARRMSAAGMSRVHVGLKDAREDLSDLRGIVRDAIIPAGMPYIPLCSLSTLPWCS